MIVELGHLALCLAPLAAAIRAGAHFIGLRNENAALLRLSDAAA